MAERLIVEYIRHGINGNKRKPRKYLVVTGSNDELLGRLDYSNTWGFDAHALAEWR